MMSNRDKKLLDKIKNNTYRLRKNGQLPYSLYICILNLNYDSNTLDIMYLKDLADKYTRVGGYYIRHPDMAIDCDKELKEKGFIKV